MIIPERINALIAAIEASNAVNMLRWQTCSRTGPYPPAHIADLHPCGNTACIGGHLALMPEFRAIGGGASYCGSPELHGDNGVYAVQRWLCEEERDLLTNLKITLLITESVHTGLHTMRLMRWDDWKAPEAVAALKILRDKPELTLEEFYLELSRL